MTSAISMRRILALAFVIFPLFVFGQVDMGTIEGRVADPSGAVIVGASVEAVNVLTGVHSVAITNAEGLFAFPPLAIGDYSVSAIATGFKKFEQTGVRLVSGTNVKLNINIQVGASSEVVTVTGQASTVDTVSSSVGVTRTSEELSKLPLTTANGRGRQVQSILRTFPGVTYGPSAYTEDLLMGYSNAMNGSNSSAESYEIDGTSAATQFNTKAQENVGLNPEAVEELRLESNPNAEHGSDLGNIVSIVTKSGTNKYHATAYGYYTDDRFNAADWFANANPAIPADQKRSPLHQAEVGVTGGGPIIKNRLFFFTTWDRYHYRVVSNAATATLPTDKMRQGDFSELLGSQIGTDVLGRPVYQGEIYNPATNRSDGQGGTIRDPFSYNGQLNVIDPSLLSAPSVVLLTAIPKPTSQGLTNDWTGPSPASGTDSNRETLKVDFDKGKNKLTGALELVTGFNQVNACVNAWAAAPGLPVISCILSNPTNKRFDVSDVVALSPSLVFEGSFSRNFWTYVVSTCCAGSTFGKTMGLQGLASENVPFIFTQNYGIMGYHIGHQNSLTGTWNLASSLSWLKGKHSYKFGYQYEHAWGTEKDDTFAGGWYQFSGRETTLPGFSGTGWDFASLMLGLSDTVQAAIPGSVSTNHAVEWGIYAQDSWRVTPRLTVNYGLRWDLGVPGGDCRVPFSTFDPTVPNPAAGGRLGALAFYGPNLGHRCTTRNIDLADIGPRLGFAYQLNSKTVLRAYYGISYMNNSGGGLTYQQTQTRGGSRTTQDNGVTAAANWGQPFDPSIIPPSAAQSTDPSQSNGGAVGWSKFGDNAAAGGQNIGVGVERQFPGGIIVKADYIGKFIRNLPATLEFDATPLKYLSLGSLLLQDMNSTDPSIQQAIAQAGISLPYPGFTGSVAQALRPYPQYTSVTESSTAGFSDYNAIELTAQKHYGHGLSILAAYTVSKYLDLEAYQDPELRQQEGKALPSSTSGLADRPQTINISYMYELPVGPGKRFANTSNPVLGRVIGGWSVAAMQNYFSGMPLVITGNAASPIFGSQWVVRNPGVPVVSNSCHSGALEHYDPTNPNAHLYLNAAAFSDPAPYTLGDAHTLPDVRDCGVRMENITVLKDTRVTEGVKLKFGVDFFNAFNRHLWATPNTDIDSPAFGSITSTSYPPRNIQFNARVEF